MEIYFFTGMASGYILQLGLTQDIFLGQLGVSGVLVSKKNLLFFHFWVYIQEPGCISKYGKSGYAKMKNSNKIGKKSGKKYGMVLTVSGGVFRVQCTFPNMESEAVLNVK